MIQVTYYYYYFITFFYYYYILKINKYKKKGVLSDGEDDRGVLSDDDPIKQKAKQWRNVPVPPIPSTPKSKTLPRKMPTDEPTFQAPPPPPPPKKQVTIPAILRATSPSNDFLDEDEPETRMRSKSTPAD